MVFDTAGFRRFAPTVFPEADDLVIAGGENQRRIREVGLAVVAATPIPSDPFLWDGAFPGTARFRAAEAIHRARPAQQSIEQSPTDAPTIRASTPRATHTFPARSRQGGASWRRRWK
jgi:hypothetical protein